MSTSSLYFCGVIHYVIDNENEAENVYREERVNYEQCILLKQVTEIDTKRRKKYPKKGVILLKIFSIGLNY